MAISRVLCLCLSITVVTCYPSFINKFPADMNITNIKNPFCPDKPDQDWRRLGHVHQDEQLSGNNIRNQFGKDFALFGKEWNTVLCELDSDGDGIKNGMELQVPDCSQPNLIDTSLPQSHPGICEPVTSTNCTQYNCKLVPSMSCTNITYACDAEVTATVTVVNTNLGVGTGTLNAFVSENAGTHNTFTSESTGTPNAFGSGNTGTLNAVARESTGTQTAVASESTGTQTAVASESTGTQTAVASESTGTQTVVASESTGAQNIPGSESTGTQNALGSESVGATVSQAQIDNLKMKIVIDNRRIHDEQTVILQRIIALLNSRRISPRLPVDALIFRLVENYRTLARDRDNLIIEMNYLNNLSSNQKK